ncbi:MAG: diaminopimelate epimerase [bacterium]|nr:diaminopimelate epimerase [bacterium]
MKFYKYEATGNDFIIIDLDEESFEIDQDRIKQLCNRHYGIGADGILIVKKHNILFSMRIFNSDGSEAEMCGNGIRCVGVYLANKYGINIIDVNTLAGIKKIEVTGNEVKVNMGMARFCGDGFNRKLKVLDREFEYIEVNMGNPHRVIFVEDVDEVDIYKYGPILENTKDCCFERANIEFVEVNKDRLYVRVWERGAGATLSCGTGACAAKVAYRQIGKDSIILPGGRLEVENIDGNLYLKGPANKVFEGVI